MAERDMLRHGNGRVGVLVDSMTSTLEARDTKIIFYAPRLDQVTLVCTYVAPRASLPLCYID